MGNSSDIDPLDKNCPIGWNVLPDQKTQERSFACSGTADHGNELPLFDFHINVVKGNDPLRIGFGDVLKLDHNS